MLEAKKNICYNTTKEKALKERKIMDFIETLWLVETKIEVISNGSGAVIWLSTYTRVMCLR